MSQSIATLTANKDWLSGPTMTALEILQQQRAAQANQTVGGLLCGGLTEHLVGRRDERATGDARYAALDEAYAACFETAAITGSSWMTLNADGNSFALRQHEPFASSDAIREQATQAERARIREELQKLKPRIRPSHGDWARAWRDAGAMALWEQIDAAIKP
jgi:hypothetical protein